MTTLRVALDAAQMLAISKQVAAALDEMGRKAKETGNAFDNTERRTEATARSLDTTRESLKATAGAIQAAGNVRNLVESLKQVDGGFASVANVAANAAQTLLAFARAADDFRDLQQLGTVFVDLPGPLNEAAQAAEGVGDAAQAAGAAIGAQAAATSTATGATSLFTRATLALRAAWAAHPVLLIGTVLAAAATAMAAFGSSTRKTADDTAALSEQQKALEQALKNVQRIRAEGRLGEQFGIAGAADTARRRERETVFQQAVEVEQLRLQGGGRVPLSTLGAAGTPEDIISSRARLTVQFQQDLDRETQAAALRLRQTLRGEGTGPLPTLSQKQLDDLRTRVTKEVRDSFTVGYDEAIQILQGRFDEIGEGIQQATQSAQQQAQPSGVAFGINESMGRVQAQIDAEIARRAVIDQINGGLAEENRLAGLTESVREREIALLRIKQEAAQQGVELTEQELANIEAQYAARQRQTQLERQAQFNREVVQPSEEGLRLAGFDQNEREIQAAIAAAQAQAQSSGVQLRQAEADQIRANMEAMQQMEVLRATGQEVGSALGNAFVNAATGVGTLRQALAGLLQDLLRIAAQRAILGPLANAFGNLFAGPGGGNGFGQTSGQASYDAGAASQTYRGNTLPAP
jgi:hypothetical protein